MRFAYEQAEIESTGGHEALIIGFDLGLPSLFNVEWLIDMAERGEWSGLWW
jgi:hypothetical protein